jgi:hypothetical protein
MRGTDTKRPDLRVGPAEEGVGSRHRIPTQTRAREALGVGAFDAGLLGPAHSVGYIVAGAGTAFERGGQAAVGFAEDDFGEGAAAVTLGLQGAPLSNYVAAEAG